MTRRERLLREFGKWDVREGSPGPAGVTWVEPLKSWNFALYSRRATGVTLLLYDENDPVRPMREIVLNPRINKSGRIWHCWVPAVDAPGAVRYAYRVEGRYDPRAGYRFDPSKILLDPFAHSVYFPPDYSRDAAATPGPNDGRAPLGVLPTREEEEFDWGDTYLPRRSHDLIVYELHVKGFTARANSGVTPSNRGTFAGLIEKIPYLLELGVTAVELMPIHQYDPNEGNYWGYMTLNFFSPHRSYASGEPIDEFRRMVKAFHEKNIEVWVDVVYNHTSEGGSDGPTYSYRGIDNQSYYILSRDRATYDNSSGCGNTIRCDHPAVRALILESLRFWMNQMRVDGFRFDLASIFTRQSDGSVNLDHPPLIMDIGLLASRNGTRLIAEAWDIGSYLLGRAFPGINWRQWNGKFRDDVRDFVRGVPGRVGSLMIRLYGSNDLFPDDLHHSYRPFQSVNFITAHDGFCLYDLVSYNVKHNEANGHGNQDGSDDNRSWNCGYEGQCGAPDEVVNLRKRQVRNFMCLLMLANGTPMICAGDEFLTTRKGNNNPYNQDNELNYIDWNLLETNRDMFRFLQRLIAFRKAHPSIARSSYWRDDIKWYGCGPWTDLSENGRTLAYCLRGKSVDDSDIYVAINGGDRHEVFHIQEGRASDWTLVADTFAPDVTGKALDSLNYIVGPRTISIFVSKT
jgi:glycogen operon protein